MQSKGRGMAVAAAKRLMSATDRVYPTAHTAEALVRLLWDKASCRLEMQQEEGVGRQRALPMRIACSLQVGTMHAQVSWRWWGSGPAPTHTRLVQRDIVKIQSSGRWMKACTVLLEGWGTLGRCIAHHNNCEDV